MSGQHPSDYLYTPAHEWLSVAGDVVTVGISSYAQEALGDIVYVSLPDVGAPVVAGSSFGEVESTKSVSDVYAPVDGEVVERNEALEQTPEQVNADPYGEGWLIRIRVAPGTSVDRSAFLDDAAYAALTAA